MLSCFMKTHIMSAKLVIINFTCKHMEENQSYDISTFKKQVKLPKGNRRVKPQYNLIDKNAQMHISAKVNKHNVFVTF